MAVWIDSDIGFDDIWSVLMVAASEKIAGLSLSFGCTQLARVQDSASRAAALFDWTFPIYVGAARPLLGPVITAEDVLGPTGMRGGDLPSAPLRDDGDAVAALAAWARDGAGPKRVLALAPLTNLAALYLAYPDAASRIDEIVWMGGALTTGNQTASAEYNAFADVEALAVLLDRGAPLRLVELDACRRVLVGAAQIDAVRAGGHAQAKLLASLLDGYVDIARSRGREKMAVYDPVAAAVFLDPSLGRYMPARIDVELQGLTRGRTVIDTRKTVTPNASFLSELDADAVLRRCMAALTG
ncbi:nucleoside hydrolase [Roseiterribacter gracilis]|uniref:Nucleoside hydrolase n=1 Tax=Roseiterribacter gracilis TaxID=2812848 RepID=A0A8S8X950_9PROT|nr:nucleoside hydrolase [Rhodospirillales bacterium TMPK1]